MLASVNKAIVSSYRRPLAWIAILSILFIFLVKRMLLCQKKRLTQNGKPFMNDADTINQPTVFQRPE
jgi:hypothetical protein